MVVIAIISILATIVFASLQQARKKARDADRTSDISQLEAALHAYAIAKGSYPSASDGPCNHDTSFNSNGCLQVLVTAGLFTSLPTDPDTTKKYYYDNWCRDNNTSIPTQYRLWALGELNHGSLADNWWRDTDIGATTCNDPS